MTASVGSAPGRLDLVGGVADYAGALVLEVPTRVNTRVIAEPAPAFEVGDVSLSPAELRELAGLPDSDVRAELASAARWTRYPLGVVLMLLRHDAIEPPTVRLTVESDVPIAMGASSSAALEVATARALGADRTLGPIDLAMLCQAAENRIVGAACGVMDQVTVALGEPGAVLPILCRPASAELPVRLPIDIEVVGWPSGRAHDVAGDPYGRARAASFMGRRIAGLPVSWTSELPPSCLVDLPEEVDGASFLDRWSSAEDPLSTIDPDEIYPVRAATAFGVEEHRRSIAALDHLRAGDFAALRPLLAASHAGYTAMGLGHPATDRILAEAFDRPGVHAARTSGGGSGGTVVVLSDVGAVDDIEGIIR
jgi:L-arabinokinase